MSIILVILLLAGNAVPKYPPQEKSNRDFEELLSPKELAKYQKSSSYKDRINLYREIFERLSRRLRVHVKRREIEKTIEHLHMIRAVARCAVNEPSRETAKAKDIRSKEVRKLEIRLRKMLQGLNDYRLSVPLTYRHEFETASEDLDKLRDQLLTQLFNIRIGAIPYRTMDFFPASPPETFTEKKNRRLCDPMNFVRAAVL